MIKYGHDKAEIALFQVVPRGNVVVDYGVRGLCACTGGCVRDNRGLQPHVLYKVLQVHVTGQLHL